MTSKAIFRSGGTLSKTVGQIDFQPAVLDLAGKSEWGTTFLKLLVKRLQFISGLNISQAQI